MLGHVGVLLLAFFAFFGLLGVQLFGGKQLVESDGSGVSRGTQHFAHVAKSASSEQDLSVGRLSRIRAIRYGFAFFVLASPEYMRNSRPLMLTLFQVDHVASNYLRRGAILRRLHRIRLICSRCPPRKLVSSRAGAQPWTAFRFVNRPTLGTLTLTTSGMRASQYSC